MGLLTPDPGTLFWMVIIFGIVFFILAKYAFPVITGMVDKRKQYIDSSLEAARQANEQLQQVKAESEALLARADRHTERSFRHARPHHRRSTRTGSHRSAESFG